MFIKSICILNQYKVIEVKLKEYKIDLKYGLLLSFQMFHKKDIYLFQHYYLQEICSLI